MTIRIVGGLPTGYTQEDFNAMLGESLAGCTCIPDIQIIPHDTTTELRILHDDDCARLRDSQLSETRKL